MFTEQEWNEIQETYQFKLTQGERQQQKKEATRLHYALNKMGIKAQFKPTNNDLNQAVIELPKNLWLMVVMENGLCYHICEDREGMCVNFYYEDSGQLMSELPSLIGSDKVVDNLQRFLQRGEATG